MINLKSKCCGCEACANACPKKCIAMVMDNEGFSYPKIDKEKCINCGICEKVCPVMKEKKKEIEVPVCFAAVNKNKDICLDSSSGGVFDLLAKWILSKDGVVYGAAFNEKNGVEHIRVEEEHGIALLRKSKYVQSTIGNKYSKVKVDLENGKYVLFTGTPCQIEALKGYLIKDYEKLYTQDIICHGVPSKKVWDKYLKEKGIIEKSRINFRDKTKGWENYSTKIEYADSILNVCHSEDSFMNTFLSDCNLRPSCFDCKFKKTNKASDITLGDFWGVKKTYPELHHKEGVSLVMIHSNKGKEMFEGVCENLKFEQVEYNNAILYNKAYIKSSKPNKHRKYFFKNLESSSLDQLCKKCCTQSWMDKFKYKIKLVTKKVVFRKK